MLLEMDMLLAEASVSRIRPVSNAGVKIISRDVSCFLFLTKIGGSLCSPSSVTDSSLE